MHLFVAGAAQAHRVDGRRAGQELVEQDPQLIDVGTRVDVEPAHLGLLRAHVLRRSDELVELGKEGLLGQLLVDRLGASIKGGAPPIGARAAPPRPSGFRGKAGGRPSGPLGVALQAQHLAREPSAREGLVALDRRIGDIEFGDRLRDRESGEPSESRDLCFARGGRVEALEGFLE